MQASVTRAIIESVLTRLLSAFALACAVFAQQPPAFEVASVKIAEPITPALVQSGRLKMGVSIDARNVRISQFSMLELLCLAFQVKGHQLSAPTWIVTERYDVQAKLPEGASRGQVPAMLQTLLAERFGLRVHRETRDLSVLALVVAKGGHHLTPAAPADSTPQPQIRGGIAVGRDGSFAATGAGGDSQVTPGPGGNLHIENKKMTLRGFVDFINRYCERPVIDATGVEGTYDMQFDVSGEEVRQAARAHGVNVPPSEGPSDPAGVSLASSLQRLGLKLEGRKAPTEVIVIDKVEKVPTEN